MIQFVFQAYEKNTANNSWLLSLLKPTLNNNQYFLLFRNCSPYNYFMMKRVIIIITIIIMTIKFLEMK